MATLQEHYNLIIEGKATDKDVFLKNAKALFPQYIPNHYGFDLTAKILKQKSVLTEGYIDLGCGCSSKPPKKEDYELEFQKFLKESEEKSIKSDLKKTDKSVEDVQNRGYNSKDYKNIDNVIYDQLQRGIYTEMSEDPSQDLQAVKDKVLKNLAKDPIYYTKNSAFGIKNIGYTDKLPGANPSKTDQMTPVSKEKIKANVKDSLTKTESAKKGSKPKAIKDEMTLTPKNSKGVKKMDLPGKEKIIKLKEGMGLADLLGEDHLKNETKSLKIGDKINDQDRKVVIININPEKNYVEVETIDGTNSYHSDAESFGLYFKDGKLFKQNINEDHLENENNKVENFIHDIEDGAGWATDEYIVNFALELNGKEQFEAMLKLAKKGLLYAEELLEDEEDPNEEAKVDENWVKENWNSLNGINEGPLEDADAKLAKDQAAKEAEAAAIEKQRADNKLKIANAKKNV